MLSILQLPIFSRVDFVFEFHVVWPIQFTCKLNSIFMDMSPRWDSFIQIEGWNINCCEIIFIYQTRNKEFCHQIQVLQYLLLWNIHATLNIKRKEDRKCMLCKKM